MAYNLIAQDQTITYKISDTASPGTPWALGSSTPIGAAIADIYENDDELSTIDTSGAGATREKHRANKGTSRVQLGIKVDATNGPIFKGKLGYLLEVTWTPKSGLTAETFKGLIRKRGMRSNNGEDQREMVEVICDADGAV